jgi:hypothetical protein
LKTPTPTRLPTSLEWREFVWKAEEHLDLQEILGDDFNVAEELFIARDAGFTRRHMVRCFGSFVDAMAVTLREMAWTLSQLFGQTMNPFLKGKTDERGATAMYRITTSYRIVGELMPQSPFGKVDPKRWDKLHHLLEVRNRVMHPTKKEDLDVSVPDLQAMSDLTTQMMEDMVGFVKLIPIQSMEMISKAGGRRIRHTDKVGRNDECPCGSGKKFKHCCGRVTP